MRIGARLFAAAAILLMQPASGFAQILEFGPGGVRIGPRARGVNCEELRRECRERREEGDEDARSCRRFRESCARPVGPDCPALRAACVKAEELGEEGQGNCRRYREACRR